MGDLLSILFFLGLAYWFWQDIVDNNRSNDIYDEPEHDKENRLYEEDILLKRAGFPERHKLKQKSKPKKEQKPKPKPFNLDEYLDELSKKATKEPVVYKIDEAIENRLKIENIERQELLSYKRKKTEYLKSELWNKKRVDRLAYDNFTCQLCNKIGHSLDVHHISYKRLHYENLDDLRSVCRPCHTRLHEELGYPQDMDDYNTKYYWKDK